MKILLLFLFFTSTIIAQDCNCESTFLWLKETFEKNDAGFQYAIDNKGIENYHKHCEIYANLVKDIKDKQKCAETLLKWLKFFRKGHLWFDLNYENQNNIQKNSDNEYKSKKFKDWESFPYNEKEFKSFLLKVNKESIEGIWVTVDSTYKIGIKKIKDEYVGFIIESKNPNWSKHRIKFKIKENNNRYSGVYYMGDYSTRYFSNIEKIGTNFLVIDFSNFIILKRIEPIFKNEPENENIDRYIKIISTPIPFFEKLSDKVVFLRIPSFDHTQKKLIDSVIDLNFKTIINTENLIIDLRNNGGGSDMSFEKLMPIIYTNPIRTVGVEFLSTPLNNQRMLNLANDSFFSEDEKTEFKKMYEKLSKHIGMFVNLDSVEVSVDTYDSVYSYPKNVGIIINQNCGSTTEQFLLAAKQSKKVKLFGTPTFGALDISNMNFVDSPCKDYKLGYCLSKSLRIPNFTVDDKGIQPDFFIDRTIPDFKWIDFVESILLNKN
jgi:hypothetical protein